MLGSYGDLGACGKISVSTVFDPIIDIMVLKYLKSLVTCHSLFKQTSKKEDPSSCFTGRIRLENPNTSNSIQDTVSVVMSDFEFHSPSALLHLVLLSGLEAIRKVLGVGELSHIFLNRATAVYHDSSIGLHLCPVQDIKPYNPPNYFFGFSLDKTDHVIKIGRWLSGDIHRLI